jgi:hypothetical protein
MQQHRSTNRNQSTAINQLQSINFTVLVIVLCVRGRYLDSCLQCAKVICNVTIFAWMGVLTCTKLLMLDTLASLVVVIDSTTTTTTTTMTMMMIVVE